MFIVDGQAKGDVLVNAAVNEGKSTIFDWASGPVVRTLASSLLDSFYSTASAMAESAITENQGRRSLTDRVILYALLAITGGALDLWSKQAVFAWRGLPGQKDIHWIIEGYFGIETAVNIGAVFGLGAGKGTMFAILSIVAAIGIVVWLFKFRAAESLWLTIALGLITGGIIGNLYDRLGMWWQDGYPPQWQSGVRDWILWQAGDNWKWPNFNIADSLLVVGACMLLYQSIFLSDVPEDVSGQTNREEQGTEKS